MNKKNQIILLAGGVGKRLGKDIPKQFEKLAGKELLLICLENLLNIPIIDSIIIVSHKDYIKKTREIVKNNNLKKIKKIIPGGETRQLSSFRGVIQSDIDTENILIHDAARPFASKEMIDRIVEQLEYSEAVCPAIKSVDTLIKVDREVFLNEILDRDSLKRIQTPQGFKRSLIFKAHKMAIDMNLFDFPDDSSMIKRFNLSKIKIINGDPENIKITYDFDLRIAEKILKI